MSNKNIIRTLLVIGTAFIYTSCNKDEIQAVDSIEGEWNVIAISSLYGEFFESSFSASDKISESGQMGTFHFMEDSVDFNFMRNDTLYAGKAAWHLDLKKVNQGFFRTNEFTLTIEDYFLLDVTFEDGTRNSEKNANRVTFIETPTTGFGVLIEMLLEKK